MKTASKKHFVICAWGALVFCGDVLAQPSGIPGRNEVGIHPTGSYQISDLESINLTNGNVSFQVPIAALPPGRTGEAFRLNLKHNNKVWSTYKVGTSDVFEQKTPSWQFNLFWTIEQDIQYPTASPQSCVGDADWAAYAVILKSPDGASRALHLRGYTEISNLNSLPRTKIRLDGKNEKALTCTSEALWVSGPLVYFSTDGSYLRLEIDRDADDNPANNPFRLYFNDGKVITGSVQPKSTQVHTDRLGNFFSVESTYIDGLAATRITDQFQRIIVIQHQAAGDEDVVTAYGQANQGLETRVVWEDGCSTTGRYDPTGLNVQPGLALGCNRRVSSVLLPPAIGLRNGSRLSYQFQYSPRWGELGSVTLPSLSTVTYAYEQDLQTILVSATTVLSNTIKTKTINYSATAGAATPSPDIWSYSFLSPGVSSHSDPAGGVQNNYFYPFNYSGPNYWYSGLAYKTVFPDLSIVEKVWAENKPYGFGASSSQRSALNPFVVSELRTDATAIPVPDTADPGVLKQVVLDKNGNASRVTESDFSVSGNFTRTGDPNAGTPIGLTWNASAVTALRRKENFYSGAAPIWTDTSNHAFAYSTEAHVVAPAPRNVLTSREVYGRNDVLSSVVSYSYGSPATIAVPSEERRWDSTGTCGTPFSAPLSSCSSIARQFTYDSGLNYLPLTEADARGAVKKIEYGMTGGYILYPSRVTEAFGSSVERKTEYSNYDFWTGQAGTISDPQNSTQTVNTFDIFGRLTQAIESSQTEPSYSRKTLMEYDAVNRFVATRRSLASGSDTNVVSVTRMDGLGRAVISQQMTDGSFAYQSNAQAGIRSTVEYLTVANLSAVIRSNEFATGSEETMGYVKEERDASGRVVAVRNLDSTKSLCCGATSYSYSTIGTPNPAVGRRLYTRTTDAAGKARLSRMDALGRLEAVIEDPDGAKLETQYQYDAQDNLVQVNQGVQVRKYFYDSLSRLTYSEQPEFVDTGNASGEAHRYSYDANGNVKTRSEKIARAGASVPVVISFDYDALNRLTRKSYGGVTTPEVNYVYDLGTNGRGRLTSVAATGVSTTSFAYDPFGRVKTSQQSMPMLASVARVYDFLYEYNAADGMTKMIYPSGREASYAYDNLMRTVSLDVKAAGTGTLARSYWSATALLPQGQVKTANWGVLGATETNTFNSRLQMVRKQHLRSGATLLDVAYGYGSSTNNGNPVSQTILPLNETQSYSYDALNRLLTAGVSGGWSQSNGYDLYGNRWQSAWANPGSVAAEAGTPVANIFAATTNRIVTQPGGYDAAGNQLGFNLFNLSYDGENRQVSAVRPAPAVDPVTATYKYDGEGRRVELTERGVTTSFVYDAMGQLAAEYGGPVNAESGTRFLFVDGLGSTRASVKEDGTDLRRFDYLPFGGELVTANRTGALGYGAVGPRMRFTGQQRDGETSLDFFEARYMAPAQGRFLGPDGPLVDQEPGDPQSWNLFGYVRNNPLIFTDPTGNDCVYVDSSGTGIDSVNNQNASKDCGKTGGYWVDGTVTNARFAHGSLILIGTTNGENRTFASHGLGPDPGLLALQRGALMAEPGVILAGEGLKLFGYAVNAPAMAMTECAAKGNDCSPASMAMAMIPGGAGEATAAQMIARSRAGSILREFPGQYLNSTLREIQRDAKEGIAAARKALKLLKDTRDKFTK